MERLDAAAPWILLTIGAVLSVLSQLWLARVDKIHRAATALLRRYCLPEAWAAEVLDELVWRIFLDDAEMGRAIHGVVVRRQRREEALKAAAE